jgi:4-hydroxy 2-oxovalerate aldolase
MLGFGRGAGNCHTELLLGFLRNPKFDLRPVIEVIQNYLVPLRREIEWGPLVPYNITGALNQHPRAAIEWRESEQRDDFVAFYDKVVSEI